MRSCACRNASRFRPDTRMDSSVSANVLPCQGSLKTGSSPLGGWVGPQPSVPPISAIQSTQSPPYPYITGHIPKRSVGDVESEPPFGLPGGDGVDVAMSCAV